MSTRLTLRKQIVAAWEQSIATDYAAQRINSERSLQASLWSNLNALLPAKTRRMFIEPAMSVTGPDGQTRYPDIVVCNTREVIGIIELKYQPRTRPAWNKDLASLHWIAENRHRITVSNQRFRGINTDARTYSLSDAMLCVWAGVHAADGLDLRAHLSEHLLHNFMALHAETRNGVDATTRISAGVRGMPLPIARDW